LRLYFIHFIDLWKKKSIFFFNSRPKRVLKRNARFGIHYQSSKRHKRRT